MVHTNSESYVAGDVVIHRDCPRTMLSWYIIPPACGLERNLRSSFTRDCVQSEQRKWQVAITALASSHDIGNLELASSCEGQLDPLSDQADVGTEW